MRTLVWILAAIWFNNKIRGQRSKSIPLRIQYFLFALVCIYFLSTLLSTSPFISIFGTLDRANGVITQITYLVLFCCMATSLTPVHSKWLLNTIILTAVPICILALAQVTGWQPLPILTDGRSVLTTTLGRSNFTGAYLALLIPLTIAAAQRKRSRWAAVGFLTLSLLEVIIIILTQAKGAQFAATVGISVYFWLQFAPRWSFRIQKLIVLSGVVGFIGTLFIILQRGINEGGSIAARWSIWRASLQLLWPRLWLGYGADTLELHFPSVYPPELVYYQGRGVIVDRAHNFLLDWSLSFGVVATIILLALIFFILKQGWGELTASHLEILNPTARPSIGNLWLSACMAAICAHLIGNLFLFEVTATAIVFWLLLSIVTASATHTEAVTSTFIAPANFRIVATVCSILIVATVVWQWNMRPMLADLHSWRGTQALVQGEVAFALKEYEQAIDYQPMRIPYYVAAALTSAQLGNYGQAKESITEAITLRPTDPLLYIHLATIHLHEAQESPDATQKAYDAYEQALRLGPTIGLTYQQYAAAAFRAGDESLALSLANRAVNLDATDGISFGIIGWSQFYLGYPDKALHAFERAIKWEPASADLYYGLATVQAQLGETDVALQILEQALQLDPTYAPALTLKIQLQK